MALNPDGVFDKDGYYGQARIVQGYLRGGQERVLELASGKGFNSTYLARANPDQTCIGVDLTPKHIAMAKRADHDLPNLGFQLGDFQALPFKSSSFDLAFVCESICHATDMEKALSEAHRVLRPGSKLIVFDGFRERTLRRSYCVLVSRIFYWG